MDVQEYNTTYEAVIAENPSGSWSGAPTLAASGVPMYNNSGSPVWVDVSGGTVTVISVDKTVTGATSGSFRINPGGSIAFTYSAAPTLNWYFDSVSLIKQSGVWTGAPSLAATTVPMVNTSGTTVIAYVAAGTATITFLKRNGVTTGILSGPIRMRRNDSLALTYTGGTPTVVWMYE